MYLNILNIFKASSLKAGNYIWPIFVLKNGPEMYFLNKSHLSTMHTISTFNDTKPHHPLLI
jgi:hypothetical protein